MRDAKGGKGKWAQKKLRHYSSSSSLVLVLERPEAENERDS